jgi:hypothetical protein
MMRRAVVAAVLGTLASCGTAAAGVYGAFSDPQVVDIQGYSGSAMEPFITPDGRYLLFNTSNVAPNIAALQVAARIDAQTFQYQGEIEGEAVNEPGVLSGTPTVDRDGNLYFVSPRSYAETLSTIYTGRLSAGQLTGVNLVSGVSGGTPGLVDFDGAVSPDGATLYVSIGDFSGGSGPTSSSIAMYDKIAGGFIPDPRSAKFLKAVNKRGVLNYAAAVSTDGLELFFTRANPAKGAEGIPAIYRSVRGNPGRPFAHVQRIGAITGFAEGPSISADGTTLYYHLLVGSRFEIETVTRP